jgi:hypothetical protein
MAVPTARLHSENRDDDDGEEERHEPLRIAGDVPVVHVVLPFRELDGTHSLKV